MTFAVNSFILGQESHSVPAPSGRASNLWRRIPLLIALVFGSFSCARVKEGNDAVVVNAERSQAIAFEAVNSFLKLEDANRAFYAVKAPGVHATAESLRKRAPAAFRSLRGAIATYKKNRSPEGKVTLETALAVVAQLGMEAGRSGLVLQTVNNNHKP